MKPIFVIYIKQRLTAAQHEVVNVNIVQRLSEYHVIILEGNETKCELFNLEKITPIEFDELKEKLKCL